MRKPLRNIVKLLVYLRLNITRKAVDTLHIIIQLHGTYLKYLERKLHNLIALAARTLIPFQIKYNISHINYPILTSPTSISGSCP